MDTDMLSNIALRRKRIAGLLLSEKALKKKDIIALNLELFAASQAIQSAQRHVIIQEITKVKKQLDQGHIKAMKRHLSIIERLITQCI